MVVIGGRECRSASRTVKMSQGFQVWRRPSSSKHLWDQRIAQDLSGAALGGIFGEISPRLVEVKEVNIQVKLLMIEICESSIETDVRTIFLSPKSAGKVMIIALTSSAANFWPTWCHCIADGRTYSQGFRSNHGSFSGSSRYLELHLTDGYIDAQFFSWRDGRWNS